MVINSFFVISFCLHYALILRSVEVSPNVPNNIILGRVECSAEGPPNVPQNFISEKDDWVILTWKLHNLFTIPCYTLS